MVISIEYNAEVNIINLLKLLNFKLNKDDLNSSFDRLLYLISAISYFSLKSIIIFVNLKNFFSFEEIKEIYKTLQYKKIKFICIETVEYDKIGEENIFEIDENLMEFSYS